MRQARRPIVLACDEHYAMPLASALRSIVETHAGHEPLEFHVLTTGIAESTKLKVLKSLPAGAASIHWVPIDLSAFSACATLPHVSKMTYARLLIPGLFDRVPRVLYLDADILVLADLAPLWATDLGGAAVGAVLDGMDAEIKANCRSVEGVPRVRNYFNAGVLLIHPEAWRRQHISEVALSYLAQNPHSRFSDQDALNVACDGKWKQLDGRWNCQAHLGRNNVAGMPAWQRPGIVHFVTAGKPWNAWVPNANAALFDAVRSRTCFARTFGERVRDRILQVGGALNRWRKTWRGVGRFRRPEHMAKEARHFHRPARQDQGAR